MQNKGSYARIALVAASLLLVGVSSAHAQQPMPTTSTPTIHGGQTMDGITMTAEVGYPALRLGAFFGDGGPFDWGLQLAAPTYDEYDLNGYFQNVGLDLRAPLRFRMVESSKLTGSLRVAPLFHVGRPYSGCTANRCDAAVGLGTTVGFMMDIPLPKIFKLIVGLDTRWGLYHVGESYNRFAGSTLVAAGLETLWKEKFFFTLLLNLGASYLSGEENDGAEPVFRQFFGFGYKFR